ncbi:putative transient receptor potential cation channel subfamily A member 1-like [Apostichopus japonicus]|uniref:Putative transient receptor potential cation channel subfamily A member 1-like n=1 Tax=Stichopus japonicus TaxID=307972 RepID=A0A2G8K4U2_STIJA|nr:putative transient receptor potential cation channel subfamily A member 1-like [Apostichopus japonicus]WDP79881.1 transient receptor potential cation channel subfamily A member 5 [Apostichopus japonicus]
MEISQRDHFNVSFKLATCSKTSLSASKVSIRSNRIGPQPDESSNMSQTNGSYNLGADFEMKYPLNRNRDMGSTYAEGGLQRWESSEELDLSLHQAARDGDVQVMQKILESITTKKKRKVNELDENNLAPLHYAARYNHLEIAKLLVAHGAVPTKKGDDERPLSTMLLGLRDRGDKIFLQMVVMKGTISSIWVEIDLHAQELHDNLTG